MVAEIPEGEKLFMHLQKMKTGCFFPVFKKGTQTALMIHSPDTFCDNTLAAFDQSWSF